MVKDIGSIIAERTVVCYWEGEEEGLQDQPG